MVAVERERLRPDASLSTEAMERLQRELSDLAVFEDDLDVDPAGVQSAIQGVEEAGNAGRADGAIVAGIDQAFRGRDGDDGPGQFEEAVSAVVAMADGEVLERAHAVEPLAMPYVPGLLAFREGGSILSALEALSVEPDLLLFDGSGRIHYREAGLATHVGVAVDLPSVGVAKSLLCGEPTADLADLAAGTVVPVEADDELTAPAGTVVGAAVQTRQFAADARSINPVFVSPGHRVGWESAADLALAATDGYKLPEPIRRADRWVGKLTATE